MLPLKCAALSPHFGAPIINTSRVYHSLLLAEKLRKITHSASNFALVEKYAQIALFCDTLLRTPE